MCGLLLIDGVDTIDPSKLQIAINYLKHRGPNGIRSWKNQRVATWHSLLHITGDPQYYAIADQQDDFCGFAGEIYNYSELGYDSDAWCVHDHVRNKPAHLKALLGPSSWIYVDENQIRYATDPQGERHLYRYRDNERTIVASEVGIIQALVDLDPVPTAYKNKGWNLLCHTPYRAIERLESGRLYVNHVADCTIDSIFDWCTQAPYQSLEQATEEFTKIWRTVMRSLTPSEPVTISFSGGIDSSLIAAALPQADLLALDMQGKDPNIANLDSLLDAYQKIHLNRMSITPEYYAGACIEMIRHTRMPAQSWSHVGKWLVAKHAGNRVLFSGAGADELFGGYTAYQSMQFDATGSISPYSRWHDTGIWQKCLQSCSNDPRPATLLLDYIYQIVSCDSQGLDRAAGAWSRETRNPFMHPAVVKFALGLPWAFRVGNGGKPILKSLWTQSYPSKEMWPKQGFAGHANDSLPWLPISAPATGNRLQDWQKIAMDLFYQIVTNQPNPGTIQE